MRNYWKILCLATSLCSSIEADTIVLKSGKTHEGRIISEDSTSYLAEIKVTNTIKDERRIPKDQIDKIIKESTEFKDFKKVAALIPTSDLLPAAAYPKRINIAKEFVTKFPKSQHIKDAQKILTLLENEHQTISDGGLKLDGQLIPRSDIEANAYDIHARMLLRDMDRLAAARRYHEALRKWETLQADYRNSTSFKRGIPTARRIMRTYRNFLKQLIDSLDARNAARKSAINRMSENDRERTEAALAEQQKKYATLIEKQKTQLRLKWLTVNPFDKASIDHNYRQTTTSLNALSNNTQSEVKLAGPSYRNAWSALAKGDLEEAEKHLKSLQSLKIPKNYIEPLQLKLKEKREANLEAAQKAKLEAAAEKARQEKLAKEAPKKSKKKKRPSKP